MKQTSSGRTGKATKATKADRTGKAAEKTGKAGKAGKPRLLVRYRLDIAEILITGVLFAAVRILTATGVLPDHPAVRLTVYLIPYLFIGWRVLLEAVLQIFHGQFLDENFLMCVATVGALIIGEYPEAVFVMLFYRIGELFEKIAVGRSRSSVTALMDIRPDYAHVERTDPDGNSVQTVDPAEVAVGEIIQIRPGEKIPLDGTVIEGDSTLDTAALTGEPLPKDVHVGTGVTSGCVNLTGVLRVKVEKPFGESTVCRILDMAEKAGERKSRRERWITRFARYYTPAVVFSAILLAILPPLFLGMHDRAVWTVWVYRALSFLVVSCPCALVISIPLAFFGGIGGAAGQGILVKGSGYMETLADCDTVVFDKTGTLTEGHFSVTAVHPEPGFTEEEILSLAAGAEQYAAHPIAEALREAHEGEILPVSDVRESAGLGICAVVGSDDRRVAVGNASLMEREAVRGFHPDGTKAVGTPVYVAVNGQYAGSVIVSDTLKAQAPGAMQDLRRLGVSHLVLLTGDAEAAGRAAAESLKLDDYRAGLLPTGKTEAVEELLARPDRRGSLVFVGDGINDAPVLSRADVGIAMGVMGTDAAIEAADVVLMNDRLSDIPKAVSIARRTLRIVKQNCIGTLAIKIGVLILTALGLVGMWAAVFGDVGVAVLAILNAMRTLHFGKSDRNRRSRNRASSRIRAGSETA